MVSAGHATDDEHIVDDDDANAPPLHWKRTRSRASNRSPAATSLSARWKTWCMCQMARVRKHKSSAFVARHCWIDGSIKRRAAKERLFLPFITVGWNREPWAEEFHHSNKAREQDADADHDGRGPAHRHARRPVPGRGELSDVRALRAHRRTGDVARALPRRVAIARGPRRRP
jgi:hypothetical protein